MKFSREKSRKHFRVPPSKFKILHDHYGVPINFISWYLGLSYPYTCNLLNGYAHITHEIESSLEDLLKSVKSGADFESLKGGLAYEA